MARAWQRTCPAAHQATAEACTAAVPAPLYSWSIAPQRSPLALFSVFTFHTPHSDCLLVLPEFVSPGSVTLTPEAQIFIFVPVSLSLHLSPLPGVCLHILHVHICPSTGYPLHLTHGGCSSLGPHYEFGRTGEWGFSPCLSCHSSCPWKGGDVGGLLESPMLGSSTQRAKNWISAAEGTSLWASLLRLSVKAAGLSSEGPRSLSQASPHLAAIELGLTFLEWRHP